MNKTLRTFLITLLAIFTGMLIGGIVNIALIVASPSIIPLPEGVNPADTESLKENIHRFTAKHYVMPFLAHALGTLVGAIVSVFIVKGLKENTMQLKAALSIGILFLWGGIQTSIDIASPLAPTLVDAVLCYIPMALIGYFLIREKAL